MAASPTIHQITENNGQLMEDITELDHHVKQLEEYRNDMVLKSCPNEERFVKSAFESLLKLSTNGLIKSGEYVHASSIDHIHIPLSSSIAATDTINCIGCGQKFKRINTVHEPAYYIHCIQECDEYKDLNLIAKCDTCHKKFIDTFSMLKHLCQRPSKPDWMVPSMYARGFMTGKFIKNCLGCGEEFLCPGSLDGYSFDHLVHIIEDCSAYKDLNLIAECNECHFKFPNREMYKNHATRTHLMKKPKWMSANILKLGIAVSRSAKTVRVPCPGCGEELRKLRKSCGRGSYRLQDHVHMIEECPQYKKLNIIKACNKCDCKFINQRSLSLHKC